MPWPNDEKAPMKEMREFYLRDLKRDYYDSASIKVASAVGFNPIAIEKMAEFSNSSPEDVVEGLSVYGSLIAKSASKKLTPGEMELVHNMEKLAVDWVKAAPWISTPVSMGLGTSEAYVNSRIDPRSGMTPDQVKSRLNIQEFMKDHGSEANMGVMNRLRLAHANIKSNLADISRDHPGPMSLLSGAAWGVPGYFGGKSVGFVKDNLIKLRGTRAADAATQAANNAVQAGSHI